MVVRKRGDEGRERERNLIEIALQAIPEMPWLGTAEGGVLLGLGLWCCSWWWVLVEINYLVEESS